jgi:hypothetical protein
MTMRTVTHTTFAGIQSRHMTASKVMSGFYQHDMRREYCDWIAWNIYCDSAHSHAAPIVQLPTDWFSEVSFHYLVFWLFGSHGLTPIKHLFRARYQRLPKVPRADRFVTGRRGEYLHED